MGTFRNRKPVREVNVCHAHARCGFLCAIMAILVTLYSQALSAQTVGLPSPVASYPDDTKYEAVLPPEPNTHRDREDLRSAIRSDPELAAVVREEAEMIIASQLAGIPRPRYIPATSLVDLKGLEVYASRNRHSFPFSFYLNGFVQVRWFEFARSVENWTASGPIDGKGGEAVPTQYPVNNINVFEINRFFLTSEGYVTDERLRYSLTLFGTTNNGNNSAIAPLGFAAWKLNDQVTMSGGVSFVASTREWGTSSRWVQGIDRSMANTSFDLLTPLGLNLKENSLMENFAIVEEYGTALTVRAPGSIDRAPPWHGLGLSHGSLLGHTAPTTPTWRFTASP